MSVSIDTRTIKPGDTFYALQGPRFDGHNFIAEAARKGATQVVIHRTVNDIPSGIQVEQVKDTLVALQDAARQARLKSKATFIGVTGSNGKTTTKEMLASILRRAGKTLATAGNLNNHIGLPLTLLKLDADHRFAVIEMGTSMPKDMDILADLTRADAALITNVGHDHLEFFGTPEGVLKENGKLYDLLPQNGLAVVNLDDPLLAPIAKTLKCRVITYSLKQPADVQATDIHTWPAPMRFTLSLAGKKHTATLNVIGTFQVQNAIAAAAVAYGLGIAPDQIIAGLSDFQPAPMRMQVTVLPNGTTLVNDAYNANPSSMQSSISSFCDSFPKAPRWAVLGDMRELGHVAREEHVALGRWLATQPLDRLYLYGRDTRFILEGLTAARSSLPVERFRKKRYLLDVLRQAVSQTQPAILFKASRSMKLEQIVQGL